MHHPLLAVLFYAVNLVAYASVGYFLLGPSIQRVSAGGLRWMILIWLVLVILRALDQHFVVPFLFGGPLPSLERQSLMPCSFLTMFATVGVFMTNGEEKCLRACLPRFTAWC